MTGCPSLVWPPTYKLDLVGGFGFLALIYFSNDFFLYATGRRDGAATEVSKKLECIAYLHLRPSWVQN